MPPSPSKETCHSIDVCCVVRMLWPVSFEGEGGIDQGGLFRESLMEMSKELHSDGAPVRRICPTDRQRIERKVEKASQSCNDAVGRALLSCCTGVACLRTSKGWCGRR